MRVISLSIFMKFSVSICVTMLLISSAAWTQKNILNVRVSVTLENVSLKDALTNIGNLSQIPISYSDDLIPITNIVSISKINATMKEILRELFENSEVSFKVIQNQIVLTQKRNRKKTIDRFTMSGYVKDSGTGEDLAGATVYVTELNTGVTTNSYGFYSITLPGGSYTLNYSFIGYLPTLHEVDLTDDINKNIQSIPYNYLLDDVIVKDRTSDENIRSTELGVQELSISQLKVLPALFGEVDLIRNVQLMPGIQSVSEGTPGLFVRGGKSDQSLIQLDEAPIFQPFHIGGLFSVFNPDALKSAKIYKGDIPARLGGKLSSIMEVRMKEGNNKALSGSGGLGFITSRFTLDGPLIKEKSNGKGKSASFMISGRRTYLDLLLDLATKDPSSTTALLFYDLNSKMNFTFNRNNRLFLSSYLGKDIYGINDDFNFDWSNATSTLRWNHIFNQKLFSTSTFLVSDFKYAVNSELNTNNFQWRSNLRDYNLKFDFSYFNNPTSQFDFGYNIILHNFRPSSVDSKNMQSILEPFTFQKETALEHAIYLSNEKQLSEKIKVVIGLRYSAFQNIGPGVVYTYLDGEPRSIGNIIDTVVFSKSKLINTHHGLEPRFMIRYFLNNLSSIKLSYTRNRQYIHAVTTNNLTLPVDRWKPSDSNFSPQISDQISIGYFRNFDNNAFESSVEYYYKKMDNLVALNHGANVILNKLLETDVSQGKGISTGVEVFVKKKSGTTTGQLGYTWSDTWNTFENINNGNKYRPNYYRKHEFNISVSQKLNERFTLSINWVYASGRPVSLPTGKYVIDNITVPQFDVNSRNENRLAPYHRLDLSLDIVGKNRKKRKWQGGWNIGIYNIYFKKNPVGYQYRNVINGDVNIDEDDTNIPHITNEFKAVKLFLFQFVPSVTYNFSF